MKYRVNDRNLTREEIKSNKRMEAEIRNEQYQALSEADKKKRNPKKFA